MNIDKTGNRPGKRRLKTYNDKSKAKTRINTYEVSEKDKAKEKPFVFGLFLQPR